MNLEIFKYSTALLSVITIYLVRIKYRHALILKTLSYILWLIYGYKTAETPLLLANIAGIAISFEGWWNKWRKE